MASFSGPKISNRIADDVPAIQALLSSLAKLTPDSGNTDYPTGTKRVTETTTGYEFQQWNGSSWVTLEKWNIDAQKMDGYSATTGTTASTIPVRDANGKLPGDITGNAATASKAAALSVVNPVNMGGTGATTAEQARSNLGVPPTSHASSGTSYGIGTSANYGHVKLSDSTSSSSDASTGIAASPKAVKAAYDRGTEGVNAAATVQTNLTNAVSTQATKDAEQDASIEKCVRKVNDQEPDENGNVDVGGMPLGMVLPYTGKDVPAGTLRADGTTYTNMKASFPDFYEWVKSSGLTVPLGSYALVEGSCGYYGLDESTGTVRMPTLAAGVFGADAASKYGQAVEAGLPNITGYIEFRTYASNGITGGAIYSSTNTIGATGQVTATSGSEARRFIFDASRSSSVYGNSDTVTPSHVKYPWVIVVYNAAVPPSVAQAGEFVELLDKLATALPAGTVIPHAGNKELNGYLLCNGAAVSRTTYAKLFEAVGTTYGAGNGSTTFNLPNLTDRFIQGSGTAGTVKEAGLPDHIHKATSGSDISNEKRTNTITTGLDTLSNYDGSNQYTFNTSYASVSNPIYGASTTVQPPALTMRYYIKY